MGKIAFFFFQDKFNVIGFPTYVLTFTVLSTARMGLVNGEAGATLLCFDIDRYRCKSTLLRLHVLQRNGIDCAK